MRISELDEAVGPNWLYHGTTHDGAMGILESNEIGSYTEHAAIMLGMGHDQRKRELAVMGVSLSRDSRFALIHGGDVAFCLDRAALKQRYKIVPLDWMHHHHGEGSDYRRRESEEFVIAQFSVEPLDRYLREIRVVKQMLPNYTGDLSLLLEHPLTKLVDIRTLR